MGYLNLSVNKCKKKEESYFSFIKYENKNIFKNRSKNKDE